MGSLFQGNKQESWKLFPFIKMVENMKMNPYLYALVIKQNFEVGFTVWQS